MTFYNRRPKKRGLTLLDLHCRDQTYKSYERARRSFYRYVCKHEFFGKLFIIHQGQWTWHERDHAKYDFGGSGFRNGYPKFGASRSEVRNRWEREFKDHKERVELEESLRWQREREREDALRDSRQRVALASSKRNRRFFQMLSVVGTLTK